MARFLDCLAFTWRPENDGQQLHVTPGDRGGATSWGVTLATYAAWRRDHGSPETTVADLAAATKPELAPLIQSMFWNEVHGDQLPPGVDLLAFDFGFTSGAGESVKLLQGVLKLTEDGNFGPVTAAYATRADRLDLIHALSARHEAYYRSLADFDRFGNGWTNRNTARLAVALATPVAVNSNLTGNIQPAHSGFIAAAVDEVRHALG